MATEDIDYVVAAWREEGRWIAVPLPPHAADSLDTLVHALRQQPGESGAVGLIAIDDDTAVVVRVHGDDLRVVMSDPTAAEDFDLAAEIADLVGSGGDEFDDEDEEPAIAGDSQLLTDFGVSGTELEMLLDDMDLAPDDMLQAIADRLGFAADFERARDDSTV
jgi:putative tRNA adenosine deaminase-associated protein